MNILISGASGLVGSALLPYLQQAGHTVYKLQRDTLVGDFYWQPERGLIHLNPAIHLDAVINLNGVNIGDARWTPARKRAIVRSRVQSTQLLADTLAKRSDPPEVLINASAIGFYGDSGSRQVDEQAEAGEGFLSEIVTQWEDATQAAYKRGIRTIHLRSGVILSPKGGALKKMLLPFKFCLGGPIGNGQQMMSWISLQDELRIIEFLLTQPMAGAINATAPNPVSNREFSRALATALRRIAILPMPSFMVKILFGEMGEMLLLGGANVVPGRLSKAGFKFQHDNIFSALSSELAS